MRKEIPLWEKYTLTIQEASEYFHIGEKKIRQLVEEQRDADFVFFIGSRTMIKRKKFEQFLDETSAV